jgi:hypothetical protein
MYCQQIYDSKLLKHHLLFNFARHFKSCDHFVQNLLYSGSGPAVIKKTSAFILSIMPVAVL